MNAKKLKLALLNVNNKKSGIKIKEDRYQKNSYNRNNKLINNSSLNISSINVSDFGQSKKLHHLSLSQIKKSNLDIDNFQKNNENADILRDNLIKTKEKYNEKSNELYNLKLKYNKLNKYNRDNLKLLYTIMNRAGISPNKEDMTNNLDITQILKKEDHEVLKGQHLISCFKAKLLEYRTKLDEKEDEISKIRKSARINKLSKLENDNACKSLENINLNIEKDKLNNKLTNMKTIMQSLNNQCYRLKKTENKNTNEIGELMNKIQNLINDIKTKEQIITNLSKKIKKGKEDNLTLENKIINLENEIIKCREEKKNCEGFLKEKDNYEKIIEDMKKKIEILKKENEKLSTNLNRNKDFNGELLHKYEELQKERDKFILMKDDIKKDIKEKEKTIKLIDEKIKTNKEKLKTETSNINPEKKADINNNQESKNEDFKILYNIYKENENAYVEEIKLLKQKILKLEEKNNLFNKIII